MLKSLKRRLTGNGSIKSSDSGSSDGAAETKQDYCITGNDGPKQPSKLEIDYDVLQSVELVGYHPDTKNRLLRTEMCDEIRTLMPTRIQLYSRWKILYSLEQDGASLRTLYSCLRHRRSKGRVGFLLVIRDAKNSVFGAYSNEPFAATEHQRYSGNGECFLFKFQKVQDVSLRSNQPSDSIRVDRPNDEIDETTAMEPATNSHFVNHESGTLQFQGFPHTGANNYALYCTSEFLSMGAGDGHYGLWCDASLLKGVSYHCETFGNDVLSAEGPKFKIMALEVWQVG